MVHVSLLMNTYHTYSMELSSQAQQFFVDRFGYNPEAVSITRPDGVNDTAYLIGGSEGYQPWPAKKVEAYVAWMQAPHKSELLHAVNNYPNYQ